MNSKEKGWLLQSYRQVLGSFMLTGGVMISDQWFQMQVCGNHLPLMPKGERWRQRDRWRQKESMLTGGAWVVVIIDKGGDCWLKLSLMPMWNCSGPIGSHWCHQIPLAVHRYGWSQYPHIQYLGSHIELVCDLKHLVPSWQGPYSQGWILEPPPCW